MGVEKYIYIYSRSYLLKQSLKNTQEPPIWPWLYNNPKTSVFPMRQVCLNIFKMVFLKVPHECILLELFNFTYRFLGSDSNFNQIWILGIHSLNMWCILLTVNMFAFWPSPVTGKLLNISYLCGCHFCWLYFLTGMHWWTECLVNQVPKV